MPLFPFHVRRSSAGDLPSLLLLALCLCLLWPAGVRASSGHYPNGSLGVKAGTLPPPGVYWGFTSLYYTADQVRNKYGRQIDVNYSVQVAMFAPHFVYSSEARILGARYAFDVLIPLVYTEFSVGKTFGVQLPDHLSVTNIHFSKSDSSSGLSDIMISPIMLTWEKERFDLTAGLSVFLPTGEYGSKDPASPGKGFWTVSPSLGGTLYLDEEKTWTLAGMFRYEVHSRQEDTHRIQGNHAHFEWGLGKTMAQIFTVGVAGYNAWQVTRDSGPGSRDTKTTANAVGPELGVFIPGPDMSANLRCLWEYENRNNAQGVVTSLSVMFAF